MSFQPATSPATIFLSYAREDFATARHLATALREAGVEVWFDQEELRGGDAWDAQIRGHLAACLLFVPLISTRSNARLEGYFRVEWKIAAQRTHAMAEQRAFILPVAVDDITETEAIVPTEFKTVQWLRVVDQASTRKFVERVRRLLASPGATDPHRSLAGTPAWPARRSHSRGVLSKWKISAGMAVIVALAIVIWRPCASGGSIPPVEKRSAAAPSPSSLARDRSIAVLPFENLSPDPENVFFADGVHDDVLTSLQNIRQLRVVSRTSVQPYRNNTTKPARQIAEELGVAYLLEGSVRRWGNRVKVSAKLVDAHTESQLWALPPVERDLIDIFAIQTAIATQIASALNAVLSPQERQLVEKARTIDLAASDMYHRSLDTIDRVGGNVDGLAQAESLLQKAVQLDPNFTAAWGKRALYLLRHQAQRRDPTGARLLEAQRAIDMVERLAPNRPESLVDLAAYYARKLEYTRSDAYLRQAAEALPTNGEVAMQLGDLEKRLGNFAGALDQYRRAYALDRQSPEIRQALRNWLIRLRRYGEATKVERDDPRADGYFVARITFLERASTREMEAWLKANPNRDWQDAMNWLWDSGAADPFIARCDEVRRTVALANNDETKLAFALMVRGQKERAITEAEKQIEIASSGGQGGQTSRLMVINRALLGQREAALKTLDAYLAAARARDQNLDLTSVPTGRAVALAWVGELDQAIDELARLLRVPSGLNVHEMRVGIYWHPLRGHPRFVALLNDPKNNAPLL